MSNDYYNYTGSTPEGLTIEVMCCGYSKDPKEIIYENISTINGVNLEENPEGVAPEIVEMVFSGAIILTYTGGWGSNGDAWNADGDDLDELYEIKEAFSLIQRVNPEKLLKALKLSLE